jgi:class 3 adenylate cyclase
LKILVVDDNPDNIELVKDILAMAGHSVLQALNGTSALNVAGEQLPDLILLDVNMPGMTGFEVAAKLKEARATAGIPIIMLTAQSDVDSRVKGLAVGADDYLTKPFSPRELIARVERSLKTKETTDTLRVTQEMIRNTFERFVAPQIVEQLLKNPDLVKPGGKLQPTTVMFADLQGFTSLSERTDPEALLQLLNRYHSFIVKIILQYNGTIDKLIGDGVMALYNTPIEQPDHIARAVKSALHIQDELYWFHQKLPEPHRMKINFGIHSGTVVVGNVGTEKLMNFTAVGDTVNVAARLQGIADNGQILVSRRVYEATSDFVYGRSLGVFQVKGRAEPIETYEISNTLA